MRFAIAIALTAVFTAEYALAQQGICFFFLFFLGPLTLSCL